MSCSLPQRLWKLEPWGYPARSQFAVTHLKFPVASGKHGLSLYRIALTYRLVFLLYWSFWVLYSALGGDGPPTSWWCVYVTNWTAAVMGGYAWGAFLAILIPRASFLDRATWFLHDIATPLSIMVCLMYWLAFPVPPISSIIVHLHGVNALLMVMDLALARYPYHLKHFLPACGFMACYVVFNGVYWRAAGNVVYTPLDYTHPFLAATALVGTFSIIFPIVHLLCWRWELACFAWSERRRRILLGGGNRKRPLLSSYARRDRESSRGEERAEDGVEQGLESQDGGDACDGRGGTNGGRTGGSEEEAIGLTDAVLAMRDVLPLGERGVGERRWEGQGEGVNREEEGKVAASM